MILALDLGTKTGWASHDLDVIGFQSGVRNFAQGKFAGGGQRFLAFETWLNGLLNGLDNPTEVVFEAVRRHVGTDAAHVYGGLLAILTKWCEQNGIPYQGVGVGTIKKFATGKGNASKDQMIAAAERWGFSPKDDNEADAIAILKWRLAQKGVVSQNVPKSLLD